MGRPEQLVVMWNAALHSLQVMCDWRTGLLHSKHFGSGEGLLISGSAAAWMAAGGCCGASVLHVLHTQVGLALATA